MRPITRTPSQCLFCAFRQSCRGFSTARTQCRDVEREVPRRDRISGRKSAGSAGDGSGAKRMRPDITSRRYEDAAEHEPPFRGSTYHKKIRLSSQVDGKHDNAFETTTLDCGMLTGQ